MLIRHLYGAADRRQPSSSNCFCMKGGLERVGKTDGLLLG